MMTSSTRADIDTGAADCLADGDGSQLRGLKCFQAAKIPPIGVRQAATMTGVVASDTGTLGR